MNNYTSVEINTHKGSEFGTKLTSGQVSSVMAGGVIARHESYRSGTLVATNNYTRAEIYCEMTSGQR